jgi:hypothetical protein
VVTVKENHALLFSEMGRDAEASIVDASAGEWCGEKVTSEQNGNAIFGWFLFSRDHNGAIMHQ